MAAKARILGSMHPSLPNLVPLSVALLCTVAGGAARAQPGEGDSALAASLRERSGKSARIKEKLPSRVKVAAADAA